MKPLISRYAQAVSLVCVLMLLASSCPVSAGPIWLEWDRNTERSIIGYKVYYGKNSRNYDTVADAFKKTIFALTNLDSGSTYYFAVTAYDSNYLESAFSQETFYTFSNAAPTLTISNNLITWNIPAFTNILGFKLMEIGPGDPPYLLVATIGLTNRFSLPPNNGAHAYFLVIQFTDGTELWPSYASETTGFPFAYTQYIPFTLPFDGIGQVERSHNLKSWHFMERIEQMTPKARRYPINPNYSQTYFRFRYDPNVIVTTPGTGAIMQTSNLNNWFYWGAASNTFTRIYADPNIPMRFFRFQSDTNFVPARSGSKPASARH